MDLGALRAKLYNQKVTNIALAKELGISLSAIQRKMSGETEFKRPEINIIINLLSLTDKETMSIFFKQ